MGVTSDAYTTFADTLSDVALKVTNYLTTPIVQVLLIRKFDFWRHHTASFAMISQLAEFYISMSAASVLVENMFSTTGLIINGKCCMLGPEKLNKISFIYDNCNYLS
jgi:hypothetical protein